MPLSAKNAHNGLYLSEDEAVLFHLYAAAKYRKVYLKREKSA